jgi:hypothetical protein
MNYLDRFKVQPGTKVKRLPSEDLLRLAGLWSVSLSQTGYG